MELTLFRTPSALTGLVCAALIALAGCSQRGTSELLSDSSSVQTARANPDLTLPPDLRLPAPGSGPAPDMSQPVAPAAPTKRVAATSVSPITGGGATQQQGDLYDQYGISKVNPDGTPKSKEQLQRELKQAMLERKRQANPNYGTVFNIGNVFGGG